MAIIQGLSEAVTTHVRPGQHLHFSSAPSRSNASVIEVARRFRGSDPRFVLSTSGFHSAAHLLARLRLGRRYIACFFGDNYPIPRPNPLYQSLWDDERVALQVLSLLSYVQALRAGALGHAYAVTGSIAGTDMATDLAEAGMYRELSLPGEGGEERLALVKALRPDVTFIHALMADERGNVVTSAPSCEGYWAAQGAKLGAIVTVEEIVPTSELARFRDAMPIPRHKVLAIAKAPEGCHPQPLFADARFGMSGYPDDFDHYRLWRRMVVDDAIFERFTSTVLDAADAAAGYADFRRDVRRGAYSDAITYASNGVERREFVKGNEVALVLAARTICRRVREMGYRTIIAGIGRSYLAARLAKLWLDDEGHDIAVIVETGLVDIACGRDGHEFLLSHETMKGAGRLSDAEHALGTFACGADNRCLGVVGAAEVDVEGRLNSTVTARNSRFLLGSGGANDIASAAAEVIVMTRCDRMVERVGYVTSPGHRVTTVVTDYAAFSRLGRDDDAWRLNDVYPAWSNRPLSEALKALRTQCSWPYLEEGLRSYASPISTREMKAVHSIHPSGELWTREPSLGKPGTRDGGD